MADKYDLMYNPERAAEERAQNEDNSPAAQLAQVPRVNIGGVEYIRDSDGPQAYSGIGNFSAGVIRDPSGSGWLWPVSQVQARQQASQAANLASSSSGPWGKFSEFLSNVGPLLPAALVTGGLAAGAGVEAGAAGLAEGALAGEAGFLPGSFELGASGYGGTAAAGLDAATAEWLTSMGINPSQFAGTDFSNLSNYGNSFGEPNFLNTSMTPSEGFTPFGENAVDLADAGGNTVSGAGSGANQSWLEQLQQYLSDPTNLAQSAGSNLAQSGLTPEDDPSFQVTNQAGGPLTQTTNAPGGLGGAAGAGSSALKWLSETTGIPEGALSLLGGLGSAALGVAGSNAQSGALRDMQDQYLGLGAPSRARLEASYAPGFSIWNDPATRDAGTRAADIAARSYSASGGNPFGNPGAQSGIYQNVLSSVGLPQLNTYRSQNASSGQLGLNTAGTASAGLANSSDNLYNSLGYGLSQLTQPQNNNNQINQGILSQLARYSLNTGGLV